MTDVARPDASPSRRRATASSYCRRRSPLKLNGQALLEFDVTLSDGEWKSADGRARMAYSVKEANSEDSNGVLILEVASSLLKDGVVAEFEISGSPSNSQRWFGIYLLSDSARTAQTLLIVCGLFA